MKTFSSKLLLLLEKYGIYKKFTNYFCLLYRNYLHYTVATFFRISAYPCALFALPRFNALLTEVVTNS